MNRPARRRSSYKKILEQDQQQPQPQPQTSQPTTTTSGTTTTTMDGANRKIELQSPEDLTYLINNVRRAATEHINAAFPPVDDADAQEEDELRVRIESIVDEYISQTFTLSAPNLSINGFDLDATTFPAVYLADLSSTSTSTSRNKKKTRSATQQKQEPEVQYEPFDARKRARVEELARQEEDLMREIAALKRKLPGAAAQGYTKGFWDGVKRDEVTLAAAREKALQRNALFGGGGNGNDDDDDDDEAEEEEDTAEGEGEGGDDENRKQKSRKEKKNNKKGGPRPLLDGVNAPLERQAEVQDAYAGVVDTLGRLKREMPATVAKMERARVAGEYVVTER